MGCHTWLYKRYIPTEQEIKEKLEKAKKHVSEFLARNDEQIEHYTRWFWATIDDDTVYDPDIPISELPEIIYIDEENLKECIAGNIERRNWYKENNVLEELSTEPLSDRGMELLINNFGDWDDSLICRNGKLYKGAAGHDPFRVYGYPEEEFFDADTLIDWLYKYDQNMIESLFQGDRVYGMNKDIENWIREFFKEGEHHIHFG